MFRRLLAVISVVLLSTSSVFADEPERASESVVKLVPVVPEGQQSWPNGFIAGDSFMWTNGGGDPLTLAPSEALAQSRVAEVIPQRVRSELLRKMELAQSGAPTHQVRDGDREDLMFSGKDGWIATNVVARPSQWPEGRSRSAWTVYYTDPQSGEQWRLTYYAACDNIALTRIAAPVQCRCVPELGDAC